METVAAIASIGACLAAGISVFLQLALRNGHADGLREWVSEGYALAEVSAARAFRENKTTHTSADKRETAMGWAKSRAEAAGVAWTPGVASEAARWLEVHHARLHPIEVPADKLLNLAKSQN